MLTKSLANRLESASAAKSAVMSLDHRWKDIRHGSLLMMLPLVLGVVGSVNAAPTPGPSITYEETGMQSTPGGISPSSNNGSYTYQYTISDGDSITDTIQVEFCLTNVTQDEERPWQSVTFSFSAPSGGLPGVSQPANIAFAPDQEGGGLPAVACKTANISINTGVLTLTDPNVAEEKAANLNVSAAGLPGNPQGTSLSPNNPPNIHIKVSILPAQSSTSCYITDSSGVLLAKCDGTPVAESGSDEGRFAIVTNRKEIGVATNPGQFYYNVVWLNSTGAPQVVDVNFQRDGVNHKGAQAIHAAVFEPVFGGVTPDAFELVNGEIPGGSDDTIAGIEVPAGWTLWVNYHLDWDGLGKPLPLNCTGDCEWANPSGQGFTVSATITGGSVSEVCESGAWGYKKK